ncbi:MAG: hypothetical protein AB7E80_05375 [Hyphomicrobiaceae bacterium]
MNRAFLIALVVAWTAAVGYHAASTWPHVPMDVSASDPATVAALRAAVTRHALVHLIAAVLPAAAALWIAFRRQH